jgi:hypothetical protein
MSFLIDDVARVVANPMPRRKALRLFGRTLGGAFLASLGMRRADAVLMQTTCSPTPPASTCKCGTSGRTCTNGQVLCGSSANCMCCPAGKCCGTNGQPVCCTSNQCCSKSSTCTASHGAC